MELISLLMVIRLMPPIVVYLLIVLSLMAPNRSLLLGIWVYHIWIAQSFQKYGSTRVWQATSLFFMPQSRLHWTWHWTWPTALIHCLVRLQEDAYLNWKQRVSLACSRMTPLQTRLQYVKKRVNIKNRIQLQIQHGVKFLKCQLYIRMLNSILKLRVKIWSQELSLETLIMLHWLLMES